MDKENDCLAESSELLIFISTTLVEINNLLQRDQQTLYKLQGLFQSSNIRTMRKNLHTMYALQRNIRANGTLLARLRETILKILNTLPQIPALQELKENILELEEKRKVMENLAADLPDCQKRIIKNEIRRIRCKRFLRAGITDVILYALGWMAIAGAVATPLGWIPNLLPDQAPAITSGAWLLVASLLELSRRKPHRIKALFQKAKTRKL